MNDFQVPDDPSTLFQTAVGSPVPAAMAFTIVTLNLILLAISPALVIAVWRWAI